ncbi:hypothetical protein SDC9_106464 [bioreactor metagenome]|uniref:Uncharacterized protein n=1 Tax=bioreactor metagenome TaxID=1076179 RepID=A0A645B2H0_9ZZZZ
MRTRGDAVAFAVHRAGNAPDTRRIVNGCVDVHGIVSGGRDSRDTALNKLIINCREIDSIHHLHAVPGVLQNGSRPAGRGETIPDFTGH